MVVNVTNIEGLVRGFVISRLQAKYPNLDLTENSAYDDMFIKPMVELLLPIFQKLNSYEMMQNLDNAEFMTEDELDEIGEGNYSIKREQGSKATAILTLSFANVIEGETIVIPMGIIFQTSDGLQFQTAQRFSFNYEEMLPYYNQSTANYDLPVTVEAISIGTEYNVDPNTITTCTVLFNTNLVSITNMTAAENGKDKATNTAYAARIKDYYISRQLGTDPGYKAFIKENFEEVEDVYVSGYKDEFMARDIMQVYSTEQGTYVDKHVGGMVDLYIKGCNYTTEKTEITLKTNFFVLTQGYSSIVAESVAVLNNTDATKTPVILSKTQYALNGSEKMAVVLDNTNEQSFSVDSDSQIYIVYDYIDTTGKTVNQTDRFTVGDTTAQLSIPLKEVLSLEYLGKAIEDPASHYEIIKSGEVGTSQEECLIRLIAFNNYPNGNTITVTYVVNFTLNSIGAVFDKEEYRLVTSDILAREAQSVPVHIAFRIKPKVECSLDKIKLSKIQASVNNFFQSKLLGSSIEESDIVTWLVTDDDVKDYIEYIALPFDSFYIAADSSDPLESRHTETQFSIPKIAYPVLNKFAVTEI